MPRETRSAITPEEELLNQAVVILSCVSYRNQALNVFIRPALLASAIHTAASNRKRKTATTVLLSACSVIMSAGRNTGKTSSTTVS